jgi:hypothetical protein
MIAGSRLIGILFVESPEDLRFTWEDEDALMVVATQLASAIQRVDQAAESQEGASSAAPPPAPLSGRPAVVRYYAADDSVFIDDDYVIKGVAGAILRKLIRENLDEGRVDFSNRELRLDSSIGLPAVADNLEARLVLLERRLAERNAPVRIEKTARGRFRLRVDRPLKLNEVA